MRFEELQSFHFALNFVSCFSLGVSNNVRTINSRGHASCYGILSIVGLCGSRDIRQSPANGKKDLGLTACLQTLYVVFTEIRNPLRKYPGPFLSKFSPLPLAFQCRMARHSEWVKEQHRKYGRTVRIAPNYISISDPKAVSEIYGHRAGFLKGPFYEDESQQSPVMATQWS